MLRGAVNDPGFSCHHACVYIIFFVTGFHIRLDTGRGRIVQKRTGRRNLTVLLAVCFTQIDEIKLCGVLADEAHYVGRRIKLMEETHAIFHTICRIFMFKFDIYNTRREINRGRVVASDSSCPYTCPSVSIGRRLANRAVFCPGPSLLGAIKNLNRFVIFCILRRVLQIVADVIIVFGNEHIVLIRIKLHDFVIAGHQSLARDIQHPVMQDRLVRLFAVLRHAVGSLHDIHGPTADDTRAVAQYIQRSRIAFRSLSCT